MSAIFCCMVFDSDQPQAALRQNLFVIALGHEQIETSGTADRDLGIRQGAGDHDGIGEQEASLGLHEARPLRYHAPSVGQMIDCIDASNGVKAGGRQGKRLRRVHDTKFAASCQAALSRKRVRGRYGLLVDVNSHDGYSRQRSESQCRTTRRRKPHPAAACRGQG